MDEHMENKQGNVSNESRAGWVGRVFLDKIAEAILNLTFFIFRFLGWSVRWTLATLFFLLVMAAAGLYVFYTAVEGGEYVTVPNITQMSVTQASFELGKIGLEMGKQTPMFSDQVPAYHVISQRPEAGAVVRAGRKVFPTVSQGAEIQNTPSLLGKSLGEVGNALQRGVQLGNKAWIHHSAARGQIVGQDPPPGQSLKAGQEVHLLLSKGPTRSIFTMPDIVGMPIDDALALLSPMEVRVVANRVDNPNARLDRVLAQTPAPGTMLQKGDLVTYDVRASAQLSLPNSRRKVNVAFKVPGSWFPREVRIDVIDRNGARQTVYPTEAHYRAGERPKFQPGSIIRQTLSFYEEMTVEIFVDGERARTY
ncbi:MAG: PASTA domain-containing protein, partial [Candidatus Hydrogenedentes bacterium]|nr:PASTA domain-containing protein [Candidatus Hydrogenedentota bacterium]